MKKENETIFKEPDYKAIRKLSHRMDCTIKQSDFDTSNPNPYRVDYVASDIHRYLTYIGGKFDGIID